MFPSDSQRAPQVSKLYMKKFPITPQILLYRDYIRTGFTLGEPVLMALGFRAGSLRVRLSVMSSGLPAKVLVERGTWGS